MEIRNATTGPRSPRCSYVVTRFLDSRFRRCVRPDIQAARMVGQVVRRGRGNAQGRRRDPALSRLWALERIALGGATRSGLGQAQRQADPPLVHSTPPGGCGQVLQLFTVCHGAERTAPGHARGPAADGLAASARSTCHGGRRPCTRFLISICCSFCFLFPCFLVFWFLCFFVSFVSLCYCLAFVYLYICIFCFCFSLFPSLFFMSFCFSFVIVVVSLFVSRFVLSFRAFLLLFSRRSAPFRPVPCLYLVSFFSLALVLAHIPILARIWRSRRSIASRKSSARPVRNGRRGKRNGFRGGSSSKWTRSPANRAGPSSGATGSRARPAGGKTSPTSSRPSPYSMHLFSERYIGKRRQNPKKRPSKNTKEKPKQTMGRGAWAVRRACCIGRHSRDTSG